MPAVPVQRPATLINFAGSTSTECECRQTDIRHRVIIGFTAADKPHRLGVPEACAVLMCCQAQFAYRNAIAGTAARLLLPRAHGHATHDAKPAPAPSRTPALQQILLA